MYIKELWRFPVKSMAGEKLSRVWLSGSGFKGDRHVLVRSGNGRLLTSRTHPQLLGLRGTLGAHGQALISGYGWNSPEALALVRNAVGSGAELIYQQGPERFDILPLLVATDGAIEAFGHDSRRLRPNIVIGGVRGLAERQWPGKCLRIGEVVIGLRDLRGRCVMTTYDPDTLKQNPDILKQIVQNFGGVLALNSFVIRGGELKVGDTVELDAGCQTPGATQAGETPTAGV